MKSYTKDYANEDSYLCFVIAPVLKALIGSNTTSLLFGKTNLKSKSIEINRYLYDDERRFAGPKIDLIITYKTFDIDGSFWSS
ncbi:hypothetical protein INT48_004419 [Thamnidium elegans]|uniref:Uncharacterized protein n=1 Tax=Thamnidium elegans TaxID=101142 RepID=A0A8H7VY29_9FUNG|nr:hypothetical protein INT48_004419 [Thamnidium elegans]